MQYSTVLSVGLIKFFGHVAMSSVDVSSLARQYPRFLPLVLEALLNPHDTSLWGIAIDTFALLASNIKSRAVLLELSASTEQCLRRLGDFIVNGTVEVRIRTLAAVSQILLCTEQVDCEESVSRKWFSILGPRVFSTLVSVAKQPFTELHRAVLKVFLAMVGSKWGQKEMSSYGGFLEYLLDRRTESEKEGRELKYEIVRVMATSSYAESVWESADLLKLKKYEKEGPFHFQADTAVATEL